MNTGIEPKLAPPGAGLPLYELYIAKLLFALRRAQGSRDVFNAQFQKEREIIRELIHPCNAELCAQRVLIARPRGVEDSSRYWSIWMTLEHLRIVNNAIKGVITALAANTPIERIASTAAVKPDPKVTAAVVAEYEKSCDDFLSSAAAVPDLKTPLRYLHPWFGALDAAGWHALNASHMSVHRVQIERIIAALPAHP